MADYLRSVVGGRTPDREVRQADDTSDPQPLTDAGRATASKEEKSIASRFLNYALLIIVLFAALLSIGFVVKVALEAYIEDFGVEWNMEALVRFVEKKIGLALCRPVGLWREN